MSLLLRRRPPQLHWSMVGVTCDMVGVTCDMVGVTCDICMHWSMVGVTCDIYMPSRFFINTI